MCISLHEAKFAKTIHGACEVKVGGEERHAVYYQNVVGPADHPAAPSSQDGVKSAFSSLRPRGAKPSWAQSGTSSNWDFEGKATGNALVIPLLGHWDSIRLIDLKEHKRCLRDIATALTPPDRGGARSISFAAKGLGEVKVIEYDIYTIVLAEFASDIPNAVLNVSANKRPAASPEVFEFLDQKYESPIAVACFDPQQAGEAAPVGFHYRPFDPEHLFLYTLDGHDGKAPDLNARVQLDHTLFVASHHCKDTGEHVQYSDGVADELRDLLPRRVLGRSVNKTYLNGDFVFRVKDVRAGMFRGLRALPPGASKPSVARAQEFLTLSN